MGLKKQVDKTDDEVAEEFPEIVGKLKEIEDKYLTLDKEMQQKLQKLILEYTKKQAPILEERKKILSEGTVHGTPALPNFWMESMQKHPAFCDLIQEYDEPVLEYLEDVTQCSLDEEDDNKGFCVKFNFSENPYFSNRELKKEYSTELGNPYNGQIDVKGITATEIEWKSGMDVTVEEKASKKAAKGKKALKKKEARRSFFRDFFRELSPEMELTEDARAMALEVEREDDSDEEPEEEDLDDQYLIGCLMEHDHDAAIALRNDVIPRAIRFYTGEACPEDNEDSDEDDDDSDEDSSPPLKGLKVLKGKKNAKTGSPEVKPQEAPKEECKQQ